MKKYLKVLALSIAFALFSLNVSALTIGEAYQQIKSESPALIGRMYKGGATDEDIINFMYDVRDYILEKEIVVTEENFDKIMVEAITKTIYYRRNLSIYTALTQEFSSEAIYFMMSNKIPESLAPVYSAIKRVVLDNPELFEKDEKPATGSPKPSSPVTSPAPAKDEGEEVTKATFTDCGNVLWAMEAIESLTDKGIISGYGDGTFRPDNNITRAEFAKIAVLAFGYYDENASGDFLDVTDNDWYFPYVGSAKDKGLILGSPADGEGYVFRPLNLITREDLAVIIYRALEKEQVEFLSPDMDFEFSDNDLISGYALEAVYALQASGIISGMGDGRFAPKANATRAQAAQMIYKALSMLEN